MATTTIKVPAHFVTADIKDIERELVGLVAEAAGLPSDSAIDVQGVKLPAAYGRTWASVKRCKWLRKVGFVLVVKYA